MFKKTLLGILVLSTVTSAHAEVTQPTTFEVLLPAIAFASLRYCVDELITDKNSTQEDNMVNAISMGAQVAQTLSQTPYCL